MKKVFIVLFLMVCVITTLNYNNVYGTDVYDPENPSNMGSSTGSNVVSNVKGSINKVWASIITIVQVVSVGSVVIAGVRYMYASADQKADLKKGLMYLVIGATLVFATSTVIRFIYNIGNDIIN